MIFAENADGIIMMRACDADRYAGGLVKWEPLSEPVTPTAPTIISVLVTGSYVGGSAACMRPSGHTWDKSLAGRMSFTIDVSVAGDYDLLALLNTANQESWLWFELDRQANLVGPKNQGRINYNTNIIQWLGGTNNTLTLSAGRHVLDVYSLSASVALDALALVLVGSTSLQANDPATVYPIQNASGAVPILDNVTYLEWTDDHTRNLKRVLLVEIDHAEGTVYLGSQPYMSEHNIPYHDWIVSSPYLENSLAQINVGDIEVICPDLSQNWLNFNWRGFRSRWYFGDLDWPLSKFKRIASATNEACRLQSDRVYQFDFIDDLYQYNRTFHTGADITRAGTVDQEMQWLMNREGAGSYQFINIPSSDLDIALEYTVTESTTMDTVIDTIAASINAYTRMTQSGFLQIIRPDTQASAGFYIHESRIPRDGIRVSDTINAVSKVLINYANDGLVEQLTEAQTGNIQDEIEIDTYLANQADAEALAIVKAAEYSTKRHEWEIDVEGFADLIQPADFGIVEQVQLVGSGIVTRVRREPLSKISTIELVAA